ncbi:MAG TPA: RidA family protein [Conexibacter sp.]|nr:RidA family protein [Conexibacter sp.]
MTDRPEPFQGILPAPGWRRAGDFVFVSSIHPLAGGALARPAAVSPWVGASAVAAQTDAALAALSVALSEAGSSLERVVKVEVSLAAAADFPEFKQAYARAFPHDPPARTTIVVGDEHLLDGARLTLNAVALADDSALERVVVRAADVPGVPDPLEAEHASLAVAAGPFVFCSGFPATDFRSGLAAGAPDARGYHGSPAGQQAAFVCDALEQVLAAVGSGLELGLKVQFYLPDLTSFPVVDRLWGERVGVAPTRSSMACRGFVVPDALFVANLLALRPGHGLEKAETRAGIPWHPVDMGKANFSPGITAGEWLFTAGQIPVADFTTLEWAGAPAGLPHHWDDIGLQTQATMDLLRAQLDANGYAFGDVVDAKVYLVDPRRDFRGFARVWERCFPEPGRRPALTILGSRQADGSDGVMVQGPTIEIDLTSWREAGR